MKSPSTQHWMYWQLSVKGELIGLESHSQMIPMNQSRNLYIIKTWIENQETFSQISNINHTTRWWNFWKEKIGKKSCFQKSYTSNIIIWTNSMDLCVFLNKMAFEIWHVSWLMCWTSLNYTPKRTTSHWWRIQAYSSSSKKHSGLTGSIRRSR